MSARFTAVFEGEPFEIEITQDGGMAFLDRDIEYDIAVAAMGGEPTAAMRLLEAWPERATRFICEGIGLERNVLARLDVDWAEHVLVVLVYHGHGESRARDAIQAARCLIDGKDGFSSGDLIGFANELSDAAIEAQQEGEVEQDWGGGWEEKADQVIWWAVEAAAKAVEHAVWAVLCVVDPEECALDPEEYGSFIRRWSPPMNADDAAAWLAWVKWAVNLLDEEEGSHEAGESARQEGKQGEVSWQVRHFVHVMECIQAGKPWPKIEETP